ncbi:MAG: hypothetical protein K2K25_09910 [Muribaculaceae bacterium]|nr:hypothetical protein [Muribaculaceae bacterium]
MAAINILIVWGIIVVTMTVVISVSLFLKDKERVSPQKMLSKGDKSMKHVNY